MQTPITLKQIYAPIAPALEDVRGEVGVLWREALALVTLSDAEQLAQQAEGKLLRPALCLLAAGALGVDDLSPYARLAAAFEAIHLASLTHDDVVDHASVRRGHNALNVMWSNHAAILGGDYLVARALELLTEYDNSPLMLSALRAMRRMAEGELRFYGKNPEDAGEEECIVLADYKTASLFAAACAAPAHLIAPERAGLLYDFGIALGIAFQLVDDLLDVTQTQAMLGKPACGDITEGKHTLPLHLLRQRLNDAGRKRLAALRGAPVAEEDARWVAEVLSNTQTAQDVLARADACVSQGIRLLDELPGNPHRDALALLARFVLNRQA